MKRITFFLKSSTQMGGGKILLISLLTSFTMFAQNQQNTLPATGNVGVGTTTPSTKLQVNGSMRVDSSLTVKDTAVFEKGTYYLRFVNNNTVQTLQFAVQ